MIKFRNLKFISLVCILAVFLVFIGFHFLQAQGKSKKDKPEADVYWTVEIPENVIFPRVESNMLVGMTDSSPHVYESNENDWISLVKLGYRGEGGKGFYYQINFWLHPPTQAGFKSVLSSNWEFSGDGTPCVFPNGCDYNNPSCLECFLNNLHPLPEYSSFRIYFMIFDFDIEKMEEGELVDLGDKNIEGHYGFSIWHSGECPPDYHNVAGAVGIPPKSPIDGLFIRRSDTDTWQIIVDRDIDVEEIYCEEETGKGRKQRRVYRRPITGTAGFNFQMDWIKHIVE